MSLALNLLKITGILVAVVYTVDSLRKYMGFLRLKHQTKVKLLLVAIICALEVPTGAVCDADPCVVQTHRK